MPEHSKSSQENSREHSTRISFTLPFLLRVPAASRCSSGARWCFRLTFSAIVLQGQMLSQGPVGVTRNSRATCSSLGSHVLRHCLGAHDLLRCKNRPLCKHNRTANLGSVRFWVEYAHSRGGHTGGSRRKEMQTRDCFGDTAVPGTLVTSDLLAKTGREGDGQERPEASGSCFSPLRCSAGAPGSPSHTHLCTLVRTQRPPPPRSRPRCGDSLKHPVRIAHLPQAPSSGCQRRRPGTRLSIPKRGGTLQDNKGTMTKIHACSAPHPASLLSLQGLSTPRAAALTWAGQDRMDTARWHPRACSTPPVGPCPRTAPLGPHTG